MNITKDYIELCKNPKVQGLKKYYYRGDWYFNMDSKKPDIIPYPCSKIGYIWLPTGDQLDDEIVKICKKYDMNYVFSFNAEEIYDTDKNTHMEYSYDTYVENCNYMDFKYKDILDSVISDTNPLIAKLKLLISILKEE